MGQSNSTWTRPVKQVPWSGPFGRVGTSVSSRLRGEKRRRKGMAIKFVRNLETFRQWCMPRLFVSRKWQFYILLFVSTGARRRLIKRAFWSIAAAPVLYKRTWRHRTKPDSLRMWARERQFGWPRYRLVWTVHKDATWPKFKLSSVKLISVIFFRL